MLAVEGVTAMEVTVTTGAVTVRVADPLTLLSVAVTVVDPTAMAAAIPEELTVATEVELEVQLATAETSLDDPSE
jgi:hypothetical protein